MIKEHKETVETNVENLFGISLDRLLSPISDNNPCGEDLSNSKCYEELKNARLFDDPTLPAGVWSHELKKADWKSIITLTTESLLNRSKDLQLAIWLLEAAIHSFGFAALAPCFIIIRSLCEKFWNQMYPLIKDNDFDQRVNLFLWVNSKLSIELRQLPITEKGETGNAFSLNDYDLANRYEMVKSIKKDNKSNTITTSLQDFNAAISSTSDNFFESMLVTINDGYDELQALNDILSNYCGDHAPGLGNISQILDNVTTVISNVLESRGRFESEEIGNSTIEEPDNEKGHYGTDKDVVSGRDRAYMMLSEAAEYLMYTDPHSPVPYLIKKAIEWGQMNTAELYNELFIIYDGKLDIFELLGIDREKNK
jgi:type VI secretion system protein ImpA